MQCSGHTGADYIQAVLHSQHEVNCIAISSDGKKIVSAGGPEICLWDVETMQAVGEPLRKGYNFVTAVAFSPDGKMIASTGTNSNVIHIWDAEKMEEVGKLLNTSNQNKDYTYLNEDDMHLNTVTAIAFSPNGKRIVTGSELVYNTVIRIWDVEKMEAVGEPLNCDGSWVECVAFSHNGKRVVSGLGSHEIRVWDVENMIAVGEPLNSHASVVKSVAFSDDDKKIVSAGEDGIHVWDAEKMKVIAESKDRQRYGVKSVAFSPDSTWIVSGSWSNTICVRDAEKLTTVGEPLTGHTDDVTSVAFSRDGKRIISGSRDKTIRIWDAEKIGRARQPRKCHDGEVKSVAFSPDGTKIISGSTDMTVRIWDTKKMEAVGEPLRAHHCPVSSATFSPDGSRMVSSSVDGIVHIWDTKDLLELVGEPLSANSICRTVDIWAMELDGESLDREPNYRKLASVVSVLFSPDGKRILSRSQLPYKGEMICMWDADNDEKIELSSDPSYGHIKTEVVPLPDGRERVSRHLGFTSWDHDKESNDSLLNPVRFDSINSAAFSQDDKRIVCATMDGMIHVWDAEKEVAGPPLMGHNGDSVQSLAFSPDGNRIVSGSKDGTIRVWDAEQVDPALTHNSPSQFTLFKKVALSTYLNPSCTLQPDGWVTGPNSEHFLWIPAYLRNQFPYPYLLGILSGDPMLQFDDTNFCYGENWTKCNKKG